MVVSISRRCCQRRPIGWSWSDGSLLDPYLVERGLVVIFPAAQSSDLHQQVSRWRPDRQRDLVATWTEGGGADQRGFSSTVPGLWDTTVTEAAAVGWLKSSAVKA